MKKTEMVKMLKGFAILICLLLFSSCGMENTSADVQETSTYNQNKLMEGYIPSGDVKTLTMNNGLKVFVDSKGAYFCGDIVFSKDFIDSINFLKVKTRGSVVKNCVKYWYGNRVPYEIAPGFTEDELEMIHRAISTLSANSCINFVTPDKYDKQKIYIYPANEGGIFSDYIGMNPKGINNIHLMHGFGYGNVMHEIMHCLGFFHEQCRSDRDNYINVYLNNIIPDWRAQYKKENKDNVFDLDSLDFESIMLYDGYSNSCNGGHTMETKDGRCFYCQRDYLSQGDIKALNFLYGPKIDLSFATISEHIGDLHYDYSYEYSVSACFSDRNGKNAVLKYPRLLVYRTYSTYYNSSMEHEQTGYSDDQYVILPAGISTYYFGIANDSRDGDEYAIRDERSDGFDIRN